MLLHAYHPPENLKLGKDGITEMRMHLKLLGALVVALVIASGASAKTGIDPPLLNSVTPDANCLWNPTTMKWECGGTPPPPPPPPPPGEPCCTTPPPPPPPNYAACSNGIDDDSDGKVDYPADSGCADYGDPDEWNSATTPPPPPAPTPPPPPPPAEPYEGDYYATGIEAETEFYPVMLFSTSGVKCWNSTWSDSNGSLFYNRKVFQITRWCSKDGKITSWSNQSDVDTGLYCIVQTNPYTILRSGGVGSQYVEIQTKAAFTCNLRFVPDPTDWVDVDVRYLAGGGRIDV